MQLPTQQQFVTDCLSKYRWEPIPADQQWEAAHYPLPKCSGDDDTVQLWSADHTVQGLLQSVEFDHLCFHYKANKKDLYNLQTYYPQYLELFAQLKSQFSRRRGKKGGKISGENAVINKTGVCGRSAEQMTADGKKGGKIGGKITGAQKWQSTHPDFDKHISTPGPLSCWQKARGIDTKLRVKLNHISS